MTTGDWLMAGGACCHVGILCVALHPVPGHERRSWFSCSGYRLSKASHGSPAPFMPKCTHLREHCPGIRGMGRMKLLGPKEVKPMNLKPTVL